VDGIGNVYVTGTTGTVKYNATGAQEWVQNFPGSPVAIAVDAAGNIYVTGSNGIDFSTVKYNPNGIQEWVKAYNSPHNFNDIPRALAVDGAGNIYVTGTVVTESVPVYDEDEDEVEYLEYTDYATVKYNSSGIQEWVKTRAAKP
jgi:hypothetical protein